VEKQEAICGSRSCAESEYQALTDTIW